MRFPILAVLVLLAACKEAPPRNEFEAFERRFVREGEELAARARAAGMDSRSATAKPERSYRAVFIGPSGVYIDRKHVATLAELEPKRAALVAAINENVAMLRSQDRPAGVTWQLDKEPASVALAALTLLADRGTGELREEHPLFHAWHVWPVVDSESRATQYFGLPFLYTKPSSGGPAEQPNLSVLFLAQTTWVGLSKVQEYYEIPHTPDGPDYLKLETVLKDHKASELFADRADLELAVEAGTAAEVLYMLETISRVGFVDVTLLPRDKLSANPSL